MSPQPKTLPPGEALPMTYEDALKAIAEERGISLPDLEPQGTESEDGGILSDIGSMAMQSLQGAHDLWRSSGVGIGDAVLETKDFLFGEPDEANKSAFRKDWEAKSQALRSQSVQNALAAGVSQFAAGMVGAGKLMAPIKGVQKLKNAGKAGRFAYESARGAVAGGVVIDPHEKRLSDLIQEFEILENPVTEFLASDPSDSAAMGRLKNMLEGVGMDVALAGAFALGVKAVGLARRGDAKGAAKVVRQMEQAEEALPAQAVPQETAEAGGPKATAAQVDGAPPAVPTSDVGRASPTEGATLPKPPEETGMPGGTDAQATTAKAAEEPMGTGQPATRPDADAAPQPKEGAPAEAPERQFAPEPLVEETASAILDKARKDYTALRTFGSREEATAQGHRFADGAKLPWQKLRGSEEVRTFVDAAAETLKSRLDTAKGGDVLSDARVQEMVQERAALFGEEPSDLLGYLAQAGDNAKALAADMEASFLIANKMLQDAYDVATKMRSGVLTEWEGDVARAGAELKNRMAAASELLGSAMSMRAASGRALRRMRGQFQITPADIDQIRGLDADKLADLLYASQGNPKQLVAAANPSLLRRAIDEANFSLTNSLLWLYPTHAVNLSTNLYMLLARPTEKLVGSLAMGTEGGAVRRAAMKEYGYTLTSLGDGWTAMVETFKRGDSILAPHTDEYLAGNQNALSLKPVRSIGDLLENGWRALSYRTIVGLPTRSLGAVDEFMKTLRYRAVVQASAATEGQGRGLSGSELRSFVEKRLTAAFDENGRGTDRAALLEAQTATFQQELLKGTVGATIQHAKQTHPSLGLVLPFVKTPINVLRYAWKMTPGLNLLQTEYRQMLKGAMGQEAQAHAIGQIVLGSTFASIAAALAAEGRMTGGGPRDPKLLAALRATGWQPYSLTWSGSDGKRHYFPLGRFDPVGMPMAMIADLVEAGQVTPESRSLEKGAAAVVMALARNFSDRTFLRNANSLLRAASEPETQLGKFGGQIAGNALPLSSLLRGTNPDPYLRDARGFLDSMLKGLPGYSETLPPRRDSFGEPIWSRIGLSTTEDADRVEAEHNRIILETGEGVRPPAPNRGHGLDLRDVTLGNGRNAYDLFQELAASPPGAPPLKAALSRLMSSPQYADLTDGPGDIRGTKLSAIMDIVSKYRTAAFQRMLREYPELRREVLKKQIAVKEAVQANQSKRTERPEDFKAFLQRLGY